MFQEFDPLESKTTASEAAIISLKREIQNILDSYVGWFDPFCELIQNSLDSIDDRISESNDSYQPQIWITINLPENHIIVTDNGTGLSKEKYKQFLAPSFSFKSGNRRGHKGVGATYLGYGFNYIQVCTKDDNFLAIGKMNDARRWLSDNNPASNPKVIEDSLGPIDNEFNNIDRGVSVCIKFDRTTKPGDLKWLNADKALQWFKILSIKTALGAIHKNDQVQSTIKVIDMNNQINIYSNNSIVYYWPHNFVRKSKSLRELTNMEDLRFKKFGSNFTMPSAMRNLDCIFDSIDFKELSLLIDLEDSEKEICNEFKPQIYFAYMYSAKVWQSFNDELNIRSGVKILEPGIQIATDNMPQGEIIQIQLKRYTGRQQNIHIVVHLDNCRADLGRKGFQKEIIEFVQSVSRKLIEKIIDKKRKYLKAVTGAASDIAREQEVDNWKEEFKKYEKEFPLNINNDNFFLPVKRVSITSMPKREQDVIALFNQLVAGGVIRGITIMSTNERFVYDGMYRIVMDPPKENHIFNKETNPLGIIPEYYTDNLLTHPKIMEYKITLDALIEDIEAGDKNSNDIDLVVVWETGEDYQNNYHITSLLDPDNLSERQYHGITHIMTNVNTGQREMDLIVLKELIEYLNNIDETIIKQKSKYDI